MIKNKGWIINVITLEATFSKIFITFMSYLLNDEVRISIAVSYIECSTKEGYDMTVTTIPILTLLELWIVLLLQWT